MKNGWSDLNRRDTKKLYARLQRLMSPFTHSADTTRVTAKGVSFYPGHQLFKVKLLETVPPTEKFIVCGETFVSVLTGTNEPIYQLNEDVPILLDGNSVFDYVRFFFAFTRGRHGYFHVVEVADDLSFEPGVDVQRQSEVTSRLKPMRLMRPGGKGDPAFRLECTFYFKNALFDCPVTVHANGIVDMKDEELLIEDVPAVPIERYR